MKKVSKTILRRKKHKTSGKHKLMVRRNKRLRTENKYEQNVKSIGEEKETMIAIEDSQNKRGENHETIKGIEVDKDVQMIGERRKKLLMMEENWRDKDL